MADSAPKPDPLQMLDEAQMFVETFTGIKSRFVAAGWREYTAELMVVEMFKGINGTRAKQQ